MRNALLIGWLLLLSPVLARAHSGTLDAYGCHSNKAALGSAQKRECHVGLLAGKVYPSLTAELEAYIAAQQLIIDDYTLKLKQCQTNTCPVCPVCPVEPPPQPTSGTITLGWYANTEPDLAGYKTYCGTASHTYDTSKTFGNVTTATLMLPTGHRYYCAVTAYDQTGNESTMSAEVSKLLP